MTDLEALRLGLAFSLGVGTFFAPCAFPLLPGYLAYFLGTADDRSATPRGAASVALLASLGFVLVFGVVGGVAVAAGARALSGLQTLELVVGALLVALGAAMATGRSPDAHVPLPERRRTPAGFLAFGVVYAVAAAGCSVPVLAGVLAPTLVADPTTGAVAMATFAVGMVAMTALAAVGRTAVLSRLSASTGRLQRVAGVVLVAAGGVQLYYYLFRFGGLAALGF